MKKADVEILEKSMTFNNCSIKINYESNTPNKLKDVMITFLVVIVAALVVSRYCPELLPDFIRLAISVATGN
jgi:hypothetical protein